MQSKDKDYKPSKEELDAALKAEKVRCEKRGHHEYISIMVCAHCGYIPPEQRRIIHEAKGVAKPGGHN